MSSRNSKKRVWSIALCVLLLLAVAVGVSAWSIVNSKWKGEETRIYLPTHTSAQALTDTLTAHFGTYGKRVAWLWRLQKGKRASGSYVVTNGETAIVLSRVILQGRQKPVKVTFNNVRTLSDLANKVSKNLELTPSQFIDACDTLLRAAGYDKAAYPSAFVPDTYEMYWNSDPHAVVKRLTGVRDKFWTSERQEKAAKIGLSPVEVATLASIVEEETAKADERPKVARLYLNRLEKGMLLQADPTVKFAVGDFSLRRIKGEHLKVESPYNTYIYQGLPPGPIRVASKGAIDAVLNAPSHPFLYMCAKEDFSGYHNFAVNYDEHLGNARRYQAELNRRGIK